MQKQLAIQIVTPATRRSRMGNRVTADRWSALLRSLGHRVRVVTVLGREPADVIVALHARRSYESILRSHETFPGRPLIVALTGTDVYRDIQHDASARDSLRMATSLVVLQQAAVDELPEHARHKARVILQSATPRPRRRSRDAPLRMVSVGHMRAEKDPFRLVEALASEPGLSVEIVHAGRALDLDFDRAARRWMALEPRYRWVGGVAPTTARQMIADSDALVLSSLLEGGANVISEAVVCGVPVLASRISSSVALLGTSYGGFFQPGDTSELAALLSRFVAQAELRNELQCAVGDLKERFSPDAEREAWRRLLAELPDREAVG
ncbi:MAG TPA: selenoneine biosynthesis selenosugar synthase SenB [Thermoanaerobaculia bacterium]|nr:selenoneine biosynthesis selenosugar synthase SenB [Thermoanaerobaculia bacterium]